MPPPDDAPLSDPRRSIELLWRAQQPPLNVVRRRKAMYQAEPKSTSAKSTRTPTRNTVFITHQRLDGSSCPSIFSIEIGNDRIRVPVA